MIDQMRQDARGAINESAAMENQTANATSAN